MIRIKSILFPANMNIGGKFITEEACKNMVERFKKGGQSLFVTTPNSGIQLGKVVDLFYDEERKAVIGELELSINFIAGGKVIQDLITPAGTTILEYNIVNILMEVKPYEQK